jgi:hypothetical protein
MTKPITPREKAHSPKRWHRTRAALQAVKAKGKQLVDSRDRRRGAKAAAVERAKALAHKHPSGIACRDRRTGPWRDTWSTTSSLEPSTRYPPPSIGGGVLLFYWMLLGPRSRASLVTVTSERESAQNN